MPKRNTSLDKIKDEIIKHYIDDNWSQDKLAKEYKVSKATITCRLREWGITKRFTNLEEMYDINKIIDLYLMQELSLAETAKIMHMDTQQVKKCLQSRNINPRDQKEAVRNGFKNGRYKREVSLERKYEIVARNSKYDLTVDFIKSFPDFEKYKFLSKMLNTCRCVDKKYIDQRRIKNDKDFKNIITKIYYDPVFNSIYEHYLETGNQWDKPSIDHIVPISKGGTWDIENIHVMTWHDNLRKSDMLWSEWLNQEENCIPGSKEYLIYKYNIDENGNRITSDEKSEVFLLPKSKERIATNKALVEKIQDPDNLGPDIVDLFPEMAPIAEQIEKKIH